MLLGLDPTIVGETDLTATPEMKKGAEENLAFLCASSVGK